VSETSDNSVCTEKVWYAQYGSSPEEFAVVYQKDTQLVLYDGSVLSVVNKEQCHPSEEAAFLAIYEKKHIALDKAMHEMNAARKDLVTSRERKK
jgi:hypothetical protein